MEVQDVWKVKVLSKGPQPVSVTKTSFKISTDYTGVVDFSGGFFFSF